MLSISIPRHISDALTIETLMNLRCTSNACQRYALRSIYQSIRHDTYVTQYPLLQDKFIGKFGLEFIENRAIHVLRSLPAIVSPVTSHYHHQSPLSPTLS